MNKWDEEQTPLERLDHALFEGTWATWAVWTLVFASLTFLAIRVLVWVL